MPAQPLSPLTAGLVPDRDQAQPLLTYVDGPARVELSAATTANWVSKTANMLTDAYGSPERVGLHLPLHWQVPCLLLGAVAAGCTVVVTADAGDLAGCGVAFTTADDAGAALDAGAEEVLVCSLTPFATRLADVQLENLIGEAALNLPARLGPGIRPHLYGKREARPGRKMGHLDHIVLPPVK